MLRRASIKGVACQRVSPEKKAQIGLWNEDMLIGRHAANGAITFRNIDLRGSVEFELHRAAVTAALMGGVTHLSEPIGLPGGRRLAGTTGAEAVAGLARKRLISPTSQTFGGCPDISKARA